MKTQSKAIAAFTATLVLVAGGSTIFAAAVLKPAGPEGCIPYFRSCDGSDPNISAALPEPECGDFEFPGRDEDRWVESARNVLKRIESLEARLEAVSPSTPACRAAGNGDQGPECASPGLEVEKVLRRMKRIVETFRGLDGDQKDMIAECSAERKIEILEEIGARTDKIEAFICRLREMRKAHVDSERRMASESERPAQGAETARPDLRDLESGDRSSANVPASASPELGEACGPASKDGVEDGGDPAPAARAGAEAESADDEAIRGAAAAVAADIMRVAESVAVRACAAQESAYRDNMRGDVGQVRLWKIQARPRHRGMHSAELFCTDGGAESGSDAACPAVRCMR